MTVKRMPGKTYSKALKRLPTIKGAGALERMRRLDKRIQRILRPVAIGGI